MLTSMVGCMSSFLVVHDKMIAGVSKDTQHGIWYSEEHIKTARVASTYQVPDREHSEP